MGQNTGIEWCDATWSPVRGCTRVSEGYRNCWAERMAARGLPGLKSPTTGEDFARRWSFPGSDWGKPRWTGRVELIESQLEIPLHWRKPRRIFVNSMSDTFHEALLDEAIDRIFAVMALCPQHTFMVLTKRAERMQNYALSARARVTQEVVNKTCDMDSILWTPAIPRIEGEAVIHEMQWPIPNVWLGVSVEDRSQLHRIDSLRETPAALRFLSLEPLLEDLGELDLRGIGWIIIGGESGPGARPCRVEWVRSLVEQCRAANVACFVKQLGSHAILDPRYDRTIPGATRRLRDSKGGDPEEWPEDLRVRELPTPRESAKERQ